MQGEGEGGGANLQKMHRDKINMLEEGGKVCKKKYEEIKNMHYMK